MNLIEKALEAQKNAYAPYSKFRVGCAVTGESGKVYLGCNVENSSYGATICAERAAIAQAVAHGEKKIKSLGLVATSAQPVSPCGICLQVISEFASSEVEITSASESGHTKTFKLKDLLPHAFTKKDLHPK